MKIDVHAEDERGNVYTLLEPLHSLGLTVPAGFESDGASVPRFFWRVVFPPGDNRALRAAFVHDFIYRTHPDGWTRADADDAFMGLLLDGGVPYMSSLLAYCGVRLFGRSSWEGVNK